MLTGVRTRNLDNLYANDSKSRGIDMHYDIDDRAAQATISQTSGTVSEIESANTNLKDDASSLGGRLTHSPKTAAALTGDVATAFEAAGEALVGMVNNNLQSSSDAVKSYIDGDNQMCTLADAGRQQAYVTDMPGIN